MIHNEYFIVQTRSERFFLPDRAGDWRGGDAGCKTAPDGRERLAAQP